MARLFDNVASDNLSVANAIASATPLSVFCWCYPDEAITGVQMCIADTGSTNHYFRLNTSATFQVVAATAAGGAAAQSTTTGTGSINTWMHIGGTFGSSAHRQAWLNGTAATAQTSNLTPTGLDTAGIGFRPASSPLGYFSGRIAEAAVWNVELSAAEIAILAAGYSPLCLARRPVAYWPLLGRFSPEIDTVGRFDLTVTGAVAAEHPRIIYPRSRQIGVPVAAAPGAASLPIFHRQTRWSAWR